MSKKTTTINIRVTPEEKAAFRAAAGGVDLSEIARQAFRRLVQRHERAKKRAAQ